MRSISTLSALVAATLCSSASAQFSLSEIFVNPPGTDQTQEGIEIVGPPNTALTGYSLLVIEGDGTNPGPVDVSLDLSAFSTGSNGILLIRDDVSVVLPGPDANTNVVIFDFTPDIENGSNTFVLGNGTAPAAAFDTDTDNDGALDVGALAGFNVVDAVGFVENDGASNVAYGDDLGFVNIGPFSGPSPASHNPDCLVRVFNPNGTTCVWVGGDVTGTNPGGPYAFDFAGNRTFGFDALNVTAADVSLGQSNVAPPDSDNDGVGDCCDGCPNDPLKLNPGLCGCGIPEGCTLGVDVLELSATTGGTQTFSLFGGAGNAGLTYFILGSVTGTVPGVPLKPGVVLPLNFDIYTNITLSLPNTVIFTNTFAAFDGAGNATASFNLPAGVVLPGPVNLNHAYMVLNGANVPFFASNAVPLLINP